MNDERNRDQDLGELRPSYRTLNEPTRLLGLSLPAWGAVIVAGGIGYAFLAVSPLPWRLNFSMIVIGLGAPVMLLVLREPGTIGPGRLLLAVFAWRLRSTQVEAPSQDRPVSRGAVCLDTALESANPADELEELPWTSSEAGMT